MTQLSETAELSDDSKEAVRSIVRNIGSQQQSSSPIAALQQEEIQDRRSDRSLRQKYAKDFFKLLVGQVAVLNVIVILCGLGWLTLSENVLQLYMGGTLAETFGVVYVITRSLFPRH